MTMPIPVNNQQQQRPRPLSSLTIGGRGLYNNELIPTVERSVSDSTEIWARDLRSLFEHAKERFGDVTWESEEGGERIWAHKAVIYARAPKAFKERYFLVRPYSRSPNPFTSPSPSHSPHLLPPLFNPRSNSPAGSLLVGGNRPGTGSSLSVLSVNSDNTIRGQSGDGVLRLTHGDTPELFSAQLEWLYTGEGFGDVVEWIDDEDNDTGGSIRDSLGRRGDIHDRRDKLGQDLTYMWRSKLYVDVRIHLKPQSPEDDLDQELEDDSDSSTDSLSSTAVFTSHRFILCSRSPYFASVLLNPAFKPQATADIHLPTPPFTPAALHFCLGYMYAGHLDFSNRSFDLTTGFAIYRAAMYLQLEALVQEIESRIVHDFSHGLDVSKCKCRRCPLRAARVWRFASEPDVGAVQLRDQARRYVIRAWGQSWGREIGLMEKEDKAQLVRDVCSTVTPNTVVGAMKSIKAVRVRIESGIRAKGRDAALWADSLGDMVDQVETHVRTILANSFQQVADSTELWDLLSGKGFDGDVLDNFVNEVVASVATAKGCTEAPRLYQILVSSILLKADPITQGPVLLPRTQARQQIEVAREGTLAHIRRRWMQIRDAGGFHDLEHWVLKEISDETEVPMDDLLGPSAISPVVRNRLGVAPPAGLPRTTSRVMSLSDVGSVKSSASSSRLSNASSRASTLRGPDEPQPTAGPSTGTRVEVPGLRRLRLSSSASTASVSSTRSARSVSGPVPATAPLPGTASARSPTAAEKGKRVSLRTRDTASPTPSSSRQTRQISGPPRQLMARTSAKQDQATPQAASSAASVRSVRTTRTTNTTSTPSSTSTPPVPRSPSKLPSPTKNAKSTIDKGKTPLRAAPRPTRAVSPTPSTKSRRSVKLPNPAGPPPPLPTTVPVLAPPLPTTTKSAAPVRPKSPPASTASVRSRLVSTASNASVKSTTSTATTARNRLVSTASQASTSSSLRSNAPPRPGPIPATRVVAGSSAVGSVRGRAAAINAQNTGTFATKETKAPVKPAIAVTRPRISEPTRGSPVNAATVSAASRIRSPSVSSVASVASWRSVASRAPIPARLMAPTEPVPPRPRNVSTATAKSQSGTIRSKASTSTLRDTPAVATAKPAVTGLPPTGTTLTPGRAGANKVGLGVAPIRRNGPHTLAAPTRPPPAIPFATQTQTQTAGLRSPSGSTEETSEAVTPRFDALGSEPGIRREGSDVSDLTIPPAPHKQAQAQAQAHAQPVAIPIAPSRGARKTSQTSTKSANSRFGLHPASAFDPPKRDIKPAVLEPLEVPDGMSRWTGPGVALRQGIGCIVSLDKKRARFRAMIKYIGLLEGAQGPWIGIETDDLDRFGVETYPNGSIDGTHYFHLSQPSHPPDSHIHSNTSKFARQRKLDLVRQSLGKRASVIINSTPSSGIGLGIPHSYDRGLGHGGSNGNGSKRSISPFAIQEHGNGGGGFENPKALFVRPHEVVFVLGAE